MSAVTDASRCQSEPTVRCQCLEHMQRMVAQVETRLPYLKNRGKRLAGICELLCELLGASSAERASLMLAALFHDVGYLGVPDMILLKPTSLLDHERDKVMHHSAVAGQFFACAFPARTAVAECLWYHHERPDGQGPNGLGADDVPLICWTLGLAEAVEAMANPRPHRPRLDDEMIVREIATHAGRQFHIDPAAAFKVNAEAILRIAPGK